jgi:hypothetical protein
MNECETVIEAADQVQDEGSRTYSRAGLDSRRE